MGGVRTGVSSVLLRPLGSQAHRYVVGARWKSGGFDDTEKDSLAVAWDARPAHVWLSSPYFASDTYQPQSGRGPLEEG